MDAVDVSIRQLGPLDAEPFRELRPRALQTDPAPFLSTHGEDVNVGVTEAASRLAVEDVARGVLGPFRHARDGGSASLVGIVGFLS